MENKKPESTWKEMVQGFVANMLERVGENISERAHVWFKNLKKRTIGSVLMIIGSIFFLVAAALLINSLTQNLFPWIGYGIVGLATLAIGYVMTKE